jgi:hypothetical protein
MNSKTGSITKALYKDIRNKKMIHTILRARGLHETDKRCWVEIGVSIDTAPITKTISHVTIMLALLDAGFMDPRIKIPSFLQGKEYIVNRVTKQIICVSSHHLF